MFGALLRFHYFKLHRVCCLKKKARINRDWTPDWERPALHMEGRPTPTKILNYPDGSISAYWSEGNYPDVHGRPQGNGADHLLPMNIGDQAMCEEETICQQKVNYQS